jgi:thiol-disulfide isomerase/thioredoxin
MKRTLLLIGAGALIIGAIVYLERQKTDRTADSQTGNIVRMDNAEKAARYETAKEISTPDGFINTDRITVGELIGNKVILVDFWTYSCINCQRTIPYLNAWHERYKDKGLIILGVHTPEFEFEKEYDNVLAAVKKFGIEYPVILDNDFSTWTAYQNRYWPRKYLIDIDGYIVYDHIGEGGYEETERKIQEALQERMARLGMDNGIATDIAAPEGVVAVDPTKRISPEIYFGAWRNDYLGNGTPGVEGAQIFPEPDGGWQALRTNTLYLAGSWNISREYAKNTAAGAKILFRYQGSHVYMVANHPEGVTIRVLRDGAPLLLDAGADVVNGVLRVNDERLYEIVADDEYGEHSLEFIIEGPGFEAYTFTFG